MKRSPQILFKPWAILALVASLSNVVFAISDPYLIPEVSSDLGVLKQFEAKRRGIFDPREIAADSTHSFDAIHYSIEIIPSPGFGNFSGLTTLTVKAVTNNLAEVSLHLSGSICTILSVSVNGQTAIYEHPNSDEMLTITLPYALSTGDTFTVAVEYTGDIQANNMWEGMIYDQQRDVLYTSSEPWGARNWFPCYDQPFDKVTSEMIVIMPDSYKLLSNGAETERSSLDGGNARTVWTNSSPISTYLISFAAHPYTVIAGGTANGTPYSFWVYPVDSVVAHYEFARTGTMIDLFEGLFGPYPFEKYDQAMAPIFNGVGAMEHQTATTYGDWLVTQGGPDNYRPRRYEWIVAHELAHQWWGDWVGPLTFAEIWLNEGFATYADALWQEHLDPVNGLIGRVGSFRVEYLYYDASVARRPMYDPPSWNMFSSTVYEKGACVLHMLRYLVDDDTTFFEGMKRYGLNYGYGSATTEDFKASMEAASGLDLTAFFDEWVYDQGYPEYSFYNLETGGDEVQGYNASITIAQTQDLDGNRAAPLFTLPLPFRFVQETRDTLVRFEMLPVEVQTVTVEGLEFEPTSFQFDPESWILCTFNYNGVDDYASGYVPDEFSLSSAWPNPFNSATSLEITMSRPGRVIADVYDLLGRRLARLTDGYRSPGAHRLSWRPDAAAASGIYLIRVSARRKVEVIRVVLIK